MSAVVVSSHDPIHFYPFLCFSLCFFFDKDRRYLARRRHRRPHRLRHRRHRVIVDDVSSADSKFQTRNLFH